MKVAIIHNKDLTGVINRFGMQNKEVYNPKTVKQVAESLEQEGHNVRTIDGNMYVIERLQEFMPRVIEGERMGMVFNMAYGIQGESRYTHLPAMLEMLGIPYVGSGPEGHALALDKVITKLVMQKQGIPTPNFWVFSTGDGDMSQVQYPAIVKPKMEAVSFGLTIVNDDEELREAVNFVVSEFKQQALVEQFIRGREFCVGLLGNGDPEAFPVLEIDLENDPDAIQSVDDKRKRPRGKICPAQISKRVADEMVRWSKEAFLSKEERAYLSKDRLPLSVRIRGFLRSKQEVTERLLAKMVTINSYVRNVEGVNTLGMLFWQQLSPLGFSHQVIPQVEVGNILLLSNTDDSTYDVLLLSHLDSSIPFTRQSHYRETELKLYGPAIWDCKGGLAVMVAALRALRFVRLLRKIKIGILLTTDNTLQGKITGTSIQDISSRAKAVIELSGASPDGTVVTSRSGAAVYNCQMNLVNAANAEDVSRAIASFSHLLTSLTRLSREADGVVVVPREARMNSGIATLFAQCEASLSIRFNNQEQAEALDQKIRAMVKKANSKKNRFQIEGSVRRLPMICNPETKQLYQQVKAIGTGMDIRVLEEHRWSSSDICSVDQNRARIDGLGPVGDAPHEHGEYILRHSLLDRAALLALLLYDLKRRE